jgi:Family of unknown function (DUF6624)
MRGKLVLLTAAIFFGALLLPTKSSAQEVGDEKEPELRAELVGMVKEDQDSRGEYDTFRKNHGLMVNNKTFNEMLNRDPALKEATLAISGRMLQGDYKRTSRFKEIVGKYGWPGRSLVGTEAARAAYLLIAHAVKDPATGAPDLEFQKLSLDLMRKLPPCEVEPYRIASLTDRVLLYEGKKQMYGIMTTRNEKNEIVAQPIEDEANVDKRRADLGLQPLAEYLRKGAPDEKEPQLRRELVRMAKEDRNIRSEFETFREEHGLMVNDKTVNEMLDKDLPLKDAFLAITTRIQQSDYKRTARLKEIVAKYGWPGMSLVGAEAAASAWLLVSHAVKDPTTGAPDLAFQKLSLDLMLKSPLCDVEPTHIAYLTDRVLRYDNKKQMYGTMLTINEKGDKVPQPIKDKAKVDQRRAKLGLQPLAEYLRRQGAIKGKKVGAVLPNNR